MIGRGEIEKEWLPWSRRGNNGQFQKIQAIIDTFKHGEYEFIFNSKLFHEK
jgi:hypothetical protein